MKVLIPILLALVGLGAGVGAGLFLRPAPDGEAHQVACLDSAAEGGTVKAAEHGDAEAGHGADEKSPVISMADCAPVVADPFDGAGHAAVEDDGHGDAEAAYVVIEKPFVVPIFANEQVRAMVVVSISIETAGEGVEKTEKMEPRLRDQFLKVMFLHANSGGFDGSFTSGRRMTDLKTALRNAAQEVVSGGYVRDVLITEIARQDV